jgi:hypothetical protein
VFGSDIDHQGSIGSHVIDDRSLDPLKDQIANYKAGDRYDSAIKQFPG